MPIRYYSKSPKELLTLRTPAHRKSGRRDTKTPSPSHCTPISPFHTKIPKKFNSTLHENKERQKNERQKILKNIKVKK